MQERHKDRDIYFEEQAISTKKYVIPYIEKVKPITSNSYVLEVGCGEGGNLLPFQQIGCRCFGIDLNESQINIGREKLSPNNVTLIHRDIYDINPDEFPKFDIIFLRDVIEHIFDQDKFIAFIKNFLAEDGVIFFAFPPWRMPFGGHQQIVRNRFLSKLPFYHILPRPIYRAILKMGGETHDRIKTLLNIKETGISIHRFNRIVKKHQYKVLVKTDYFINPNYEIKFGLKPKKLLLINKIPVFRDFFTTCYYCIIQKNHQ